MSISPLPPAPQTTDPANFDTRADALIAALPTFIDECNATAAAMDFNDTNGTSSTSILIGTGSKVFTASTGKSWQLGMTLRIASTASPTNFMTGEVTAYNTGTGSLTVNVTNTSGSGTLASWTISQAGVSLQAPVLNLTGYAGADVALGVGQTAFYTVAAASSLLLRILTATEQSYEIEYNANNNTGATLGANPNLQVNNANFGTNVCANVRNDIDGTGLVTSVGTSNNNFILTTVGRALWFKSKVFTRTTGKAMQTDYFLSTAALTYSGNHRSRCTDTTTVWTSLGTINFQEAVTGLVTVKRTF